MVDDDDEVVEVSKGRLRSWITQAALLRAATDRLLAAIEQEAPQRVRDVRMLRDGFGSLGVQWQAALGRDRDAEVRELRPRGEDKQ